MAEETFKKEDGKLVEEKTIERTYTYEDIISTIEQLESAITFHTSEKEAYIAAIQEKLAIWNKRKEEADRLGVTHEEKEVSQDKE